MEFIFEMSKLVRSLAENQHDPLMYFLNGIYSGFLKWDKIFKVNFQCQELTNFDTSKKKLHDQTNDNGGTKSL